MFIVVVHHTCIRKERLKLTVNLKIKPKKTKKTKDIENNVQKRKLAKPKVDSWKRLIQVINP